MVDRGQQGLPYLQEHQGIEPTGKVSPDNYEPTPEERKLVRKVEKIWEKNRIHRNNYDKHWIDDYKFFRGKQWTEQRPSYRHSEVINLVFQVIQSQVPILTDARPKFEYAPQEPSDREFAELMNEIAQADWQRNNWLYRLTEVIYDAHIYGTGLSKLGYNEDAENGRGGIEYGSEEIFYCYPDSQAQDVNYKSRSFIVAIPMEISEIRRKWKKGKYVKEDTTDLLDSTKNALEPVRFRSATGEKQLVEVSGAKANEAEKKALVLFAYYFDDEVTDEEIEKENGEKVTETKLKYPNGRRSIIANGVVLEDDANPYDDGEFPFQRLTNYILPREFWGESEIAQIKGPNKIFNKIFSFALDVLTLMGNPIWVVDTNSGIETDLLTNAPGLVVEKNPGTEARRESGVQLQPFVLQLMDRIEQYVDHISGARDITKGTPPGGVTAASAIADLQNAAQTRLRQKSRNIDAYLQNLGSQYASRVMQFYTAPRVFSYVGKDEVRQYFRAYITKTEDNRTVARVTRFDKDRQSLPEQEYELRGKLDVVATTGTSLPFSKAQNEQRLLQLFDRGIIDAEEYFKKTDYPNYEAVLDRIRQREAELAAQAAQGQTA